MPRRTFAVPVLPARRATRVALATALFLAALPAASALADLSRERSATTSTTPHLDTVEAALRDVSPGLERSVWERTAGNRMGGSDWVLQTPGCWGDNTCADRAGTDRVLTAITDHIAGAERTVDLSTLAPLPEAAFQDAIVAGLKSAAASRKVTVRILVGAVPLGHLGVVPSAYRDELVAKLGPAVAANVTFHIGSMTTAKAAFSWNHSKILVVDGRKAIVGGINMWKGDYLETGHPVNDTSMAIEGPAAGSAARYLDRIWGWTCANAANTLLVWHAATGNAACRSTLHQGLAPVTVDGGDVPVIAVGGLGVGIASVDPSSTYKPTLPTAPDTRCGISLPDRTNADRNYDTVNPEGVALRALVGSARTSVTISQQDLHGGCPPLPRYDIRLYDQLAAKLAAGVKVRIVLSDPLNRGSAGSGGYSFIKSLAEVSTALRNRLALVTGDQASARAAMCGNLQLASFRHAPEATWADGKPYALHNKLVVVDDSTFYVGSKNLYPAWLQDFGYIVEDRAAAQQLKAEVLDPEWRYSAAAATFDHTRGICPA